MEEAGEIMGAPLPTPTYLPNGFEIKGIYVLERHDFSEMLVLLISDEAIDKNQLSAKIKLNITLYKRGQIGGIKLVGESILVSNTKGILIEKETTNDLWWILPYSESPGQYEIQISAIKEIPKKELIMIANSVE